MATDTSNLSINIPTIIAPADDPTIEFDDGSAIVIDNGAGTINAGLAGTDAPLTVFNTITGCLSSMDREMLHFVDYHCNPQYHIG